MIQSPSARPHRDPKIDAVRGFAIFLVVAGHMVQFSDLDFDHNVVFRAIYSFHMPLFFFISGYVIRIDRQRVGILDFISKRVIRLAIPFLAWAFIVHWWIKGIYETTSLSSFAIQLYRNPDGGGLWFLWVLFLSLLLLLLYRPLLIFRWKRLKGPFGVIFDLALWGSTVYVLQAWPINDGGTYFVRVNFPYVLAGAMLSPYRYSTFAGGLWREGTLILFPLLAVNWYRGHPPWLVRFVQRLDGGAYPVWVTPSFDYLTAFFGISFSFILIRLVVRAPLDAFFCWLGRESLGIYAVSSYYFFCWAGASQPGAAALWILLSIAATLGLALLVTRALLRPSRILSLLFLGEFRRSPIPASAADHSRR